MGINLFNSIIIYIFVSLCLREEKENFNWETLSKRLKMVGSNVATTRFESGKCQGSMTQSLGLYNSNVPTIFNLVI